MLLGVERLRRRAPAHRRGRRPERRADRRELSWRQAIAVGTSQAVALIPGISRSGVTMGGGLLVGLSNEDAARYAFLLATPIIGAAGAAEAARPLRLSRATGCAARRWSAALCAAVDDLLRRTLPAALLRDQPPDAVRRLLHRRRRGVHPDLRVRRLRHTRIADAPPGRRGRAQAGRADRSRAPGRRPRRRPVRDRRGRAVVRGLGRLRRDRARRDAAGHRRLRDLPAAARRRASGRRCSCSPRATPSPIASRASTPAPTTTWSSRSRSPSCSRGCARWSAAARAERPTCWRSATCASTPRARAGLARRAIEVALSAKEFALLEVFMRRPGRGRCRASTCSSRPGTTSYENRSNVVDVYVR